MGVLASQKVQLSITNDQKIDLLRLLQRIEAVQLIPSQTSSHLDAEAVEEQEDLLENLDHINRAIDVLTNLNNKRKPFLSALFDDRQVFTEKDFLLLSRRQDAIVKKAATINSLVVKKEELLHRNALLSDVIRRAEPLKDIELDIFDDFKFVSFIPFLIDAERAVMVTQELEDAFPNAEIESVKKIDGAYVYVAVVLKEETKAISDTIANKATLLTFRSTVKGSFYDVYTASHTEYDANGQEIAKIDSKILHTKLTLEDALGIKDVIQSHLNLINSLHYFQDSSSDRSHIYAWMDPRDIGLLKAIFEKKLPEAQLDTLSPDTSDIPVVLTNTGLTRYFETITRIMGLPKNGSVDPTPYVVFFFVFMFGLGFSEAGYALFLGAVSAILLLHPRLKQGIRKVMMVIFASSIVTLIIGSLFGSWFGVVPDDVIASESLPHMQWLVSIGIIPFLQSLQVMNPLSSVVSLMGFTVALGIIHLLLGLILGFIQSASQGKFWDGVFDSLSWFGFIVLGGITVAATQGLLISAVNQLADTLVILFLLYLVGMTLALGRHMKNPLAKIAKGLYDLFFGVIGYLSDSLSYTRLVALGLATGIIAGVVGTLAKLAGAELVEQGGVSLILGYVIMTVIFIIGHLFNIALNVLGTYINVGRLHFVEFFGKFFESGGVELQPIRRSQDHIVVNEE